MSPSYSVNQDKAVRTSGHLLGENTEKYGTSSSTQKAVNLGQERAIAGSWLCPSTSAHFFGHASDAGESATAKTDVAQKLATALQN